VPTSYLVDELVYLHDILTITKQSRILQLTKSMSYHDTRKHTMESRKLYIYIWYWIYRWRKSTLVCTLELTSLLPVHILLNSRWYA